MFLKPGKPVDSIPMFSRCCGYSPWKCVPLRLNKIMSIIRTKRIATFAKRHRDPFRTPLAKRQICHLFKVQRICWSLASTNSIKRRDFSRLIRQTMRHGDSYRVYDRWSGDVKIMLLITRANIINGPMYYNHYRCLHAITIDVCTPWHPYPKFS